MQDLIGRIRANVGRVFIGKDDVVGLAVTALVARGHILLEDVPGLGKTLLARALARSFQAGFRRIQFTPDLLPSDVTGVSVFDPETRRFDFVPGPIFTEVLLADEINRTSPRTQAALLEAMEERQVTAEGTSRPLPETFFVLATQNPVELAGTYPLPEAQLDRFLMRLRLGYPTAADEVRILEVHGRGRESATVDAVCDAEGLRRLQLAALEVRVGPEIRDYVVAIAGETRRRDDLALGVSPRGSLALLRAAQAYALVENRGWVGPDEIKAVAPAVLGHRVVPSSHLDLSGGGGEDVVREILEEVPVPVAARG